MMFVERNISEDPICLRCCKIHYLPVLFVVWPTFVSFFFQVKPGWLLKNTADILKPKMNGLQLGTGVRLRSVAHKHSMDKFILGKSTKANHITDECSSSIFKFDFYSEFSPFRYLNFFIPERKLRVVHQKQNYLTNADHCTNVTDLENHQLRKAFFY